MLNKFEKIKFTVALFVLVIAFAIKEKHDVIAITLFGMAIGTIIQIIWEIK